MANDDLIWQAARRRSRILPFRGLARDAAFIWRMCHIRYDGEMNSAAVQEALELNLAASRNSRFPPGGMGNDQP